MSRNLKRLTHAASTMQARIDWNNMTIIADHLGQSHLNEAHKPPEGASWRVLDKATMALMDDLAGVTPYTVNDLRKAIGWVEA